MSAKGPSPSESKEFASRFSPQEWQFLCADPVFVELIGDSLRAAWVRAINTLHTYYNPHRLIDAELGQLVSSYQAAGLSKQEILAHIQKAAAALCVEIITGHKPEQEGI